MKRCKLFISVYCLVGITLFFSIQATAQQKTVKLTYSHFWPIGHPINDLIGEWARQVEKRTNGRVTVTIFPGGTLTLADKCYDGVVKGISSVGASGLAYTRGRFPLMEVIDLPLGYKNAFIATRLTNVFYKKFQPKELNDVKVMYFQAIGPAVFAMKKPLRILEDLKGLRIRTTGLGTKIVLALGATPVAMPMPETYDALAKGLVDGAAGQPIAALWGFKWGELVKYVTENPVSSSSFAFFVVMNKNVWNNLPADVQKTIEEINEEWIDKSGKLWDEYDEMGRKFALKLGNEIIRLPREEDERWAKRLRGTLDDYVKDMEKKGLPGNEALQFCLNFLKSQ